MNSWKIGALITAAMVLVIVSGCKKDEPAADATATPPAATAGATTGK